MKAQRLHDDGNRAAELTARPAVENEEHQFVAAAKNGDSVAFDILCRRSANMVFNIARRIMRTTEDAEDIVQESFQLAFVHLKNFKGNSRFSTWLSSIVTNAALMRLRKNNVRREVSFDESPESQRRLSPVDIADHGLNPEQLYAQKERHWLLCKALSELTPGTRRAIELRELDERSGEETARMLGISFAAVKARVFNGRIRLRRLLSRYEVSTDMWKRGAANGSQAERQSGPASPLQCGRLEEETEELECPDSIRSVTANCGSVHNFAVHLASVQQTDK